MESDKAGGALIDEATQWLIALDAGQADPEAFETWRLADPRNGSAFAQIAATWESTGALRTSIERPGAPAALAPTSESIPARNDDHDGETTPTFLSRRRLLGGGMAGILLAGAGTSFALLKGRRERVETAVGERRSIRLPDGSSAELNTDSVLSWRFDGSRSVWLERGEAAIAVAAGGLSPFVVRSGEVEARLREGRYNLRLHDDGPELIAVSGGGEIVRGGYAPVPLAPMHAVLDQGGRVQAIAVSVGDIDVVSAWRRGEIVFDGMRLDQAVAEFNRYLDRKLVVGDPAIAAIRLGGRFFVDDPASFLNSLRQGFDIRAIVGPRSIVLRAT
jgi:transmembrane sensor